MVRLGFWIAVIVGSLSACTVDGDDDCSTVCTEVFEDCDGGCDDGDDECHVTCEGDRDLCFTGCDDDEGDDADGEDEDPDDPDDDPNG